MALINNKVLLKILTPLVQSQRFRGKINIQKPKAPHFERAKYLALTTPYFAKKDSTASIIQLCSKNEKHKKEEVENPFQNIIAKELLQLFESSKLIGFFHKNPMNAEQDFKAKVLFKRQNMHFRNFGKKTLQIAVAGTPYESVLDFYCSHNMFVFSPEPEIKKMIAVARKFPQLVFLAGICENKFLSKDKLIQYSQIPNLQMAQAEFVQTLNSIGGQIVSQLNSQQNTLVLQLQERIKQLEKEA